MRAPQVIVIVLLAVGFVVKVLQHGKTTTISMWWGLVDALIISGLLWWGGFWG